MNWTWLLFSFRGRIQRLYWWVVGLVVTVVAGMASSTVELVAKSFDMSALNTDTNEFEPTGPLGATLAVIGVLNLWITYALAAKRLHDRDRSAWWLVAPIILLLIAVILGMTSLMMAA